MKELLFRCGSCAFWQEIPVPEGQKLPEDFKDRGYCYANPPRVFPMPKQTSTLQAMGQPAFRTIPMMMRPVLEFDERSCGTYTPVPDALNLIRERELEASKKDGCCGSEQCGDGCCKEGS